MVRHAESPFVFGEERTRGLSAEGELEAKKVAKIMLTEKVEVIVSSPFVRSIQTIEGIAKKRNLEIKLYEELKERMIKGNYKLSWEEIVPAIEKSFIDQDYCLLGGETTKQAQERAIPVITQLLTEHKGKNIVVGTHSNIMTIMLNYYDERYGYTFWESTSKPDIYKLVFSGNTLKEVKRIWRNGQ